jgi:hypothetical protein
MPSRISTFLGTAEDLKCRNKQKVKGKDKEDLKCRNKQEVKSRDKIKDHRNAVLKNTYF